MVTKYKTSSEGFGSSTVVIAHFATTRLARSCQLTLSSLFQRISDEIRQVYLDGDAQADLDDIAAVYAQYGLSNENGWEQEHEIAVVENDVIWPLSFGMRRSDVEELLSTMEPAGVEFHDVDDEVEQWRLYPVPETMPIPEYEAEDDFEEFGEEYPGYPPKRVIH